MINTDVSEDPAATSIRVDNDSYTGDKGKSLV